MQPAEQPKYKSEMQAKMGHVVRQLIPHAIELYNLIGPGMTVEIHFQEESLVQVPGAPVKVRKLLITKPAGGIELDVKLPPKIDG